MWSLISYRMMLYTATLCLCIIGACLDALRDAWANRKPGVSYVKWHLVKSISFFLPYVFIFLAVFMVYPDWMTVLFFLINAGVCRYLWRRVYKSETEETMFVVKCILKVGKFFIQQLPWETIAGFFFELAAKVLRDMLQKKDMSKKVKYFVMARYVDAEGLGEELAEDSKTSVDNKLVQEIKDLCRDIAADHGFTLPQVEEL